MTVGLDTGFFVELLRGNPAAADLWREIVEGEETQAAVSCLTLHELYRLALKGAIPTTAAETAEEAIMDACVVAWLDSAKPLREAARLSHGTGLPAVDALILAGLLDMDTEVLYTTDSHFARVRRKDLDVRILRRSARAGGA